ncbi:hypothetical protein [Pseudoalteromonas sp. A41-2]|uniref:hypothetical protein n=1 Tax=Pseudoalteromonas sp. A41-2 TaxID=2785910 RepID=UPI001E517B7C|nr:hypothetical protein [Pseudoalteromonas sp. A41-2]
MRYLILILFIPFFTLAESNTQLKKELMQMEIQDQSIRNKIGKVGLAKSPQRTHKPAKDNR